MQLGGVLPGQLMWTQVKHWLPRMETLLEPIYKSWEESTFVVITVTTECKIGIV
jgi:hypothetical protein